MFLSHSDTCESAPEAMAASHTTAGWAVAPADSDTVVDRASAAQEGERDQGPAAEGRDPALDWDGGLV